MKEDTRTQKNLSQQEQQAPPLEQGIVTAPGKQQKPRKIAPLAGIPIAGPPNGARPFRLLRGPLGREEADLGHE